MLSVRFNSEEVETEFLQDRIPLIVEKVLVRIEIVINEFFNVFQNSKTDVAEREHCLTCLRAEIRVATSSMTSVPKPLKILRDYYSKLKESFESMVNIDSLVFLSFFCRI